LPGAAKLGHEVEVLTGFPNYPNGRVYDGYRIRPWHRETVEGVSVLRVALYPSHDRSALKRVFNYLSFAGSAAIFGPWLTKRPDVIYCYHPPASVALAATTLSLRFGAPFVYDVQDLWPDTLTATGMVRSRALLKLVGLWCQATYRAAGRISVLSPGFREKLIARGVPSEKIRVVYNWSDDNHIVRSDRNEELARTEGLAGRFNVVFAGTMGKAQALDTLLDAAQIVRESAPHVQFVLVGGGIERERLLARSRAPELSNVRFLERRPVSKIGEILQLADVLVVHLKKDPLFEVTIPSKTQAYLAAGRPILMGVRGNSLDLIERAGAGIGFEPEDPSSLAAAVLKLAAMTRGQLESFGENGRRFYESELSLEIGVRKFEQMFKGCALRRGCRPWPKEPWISLRP